MKLQTDLTFMRSFGKNNACQNFCPAYCWHKAVLIDFKTMPKANVKF